MICHESATNLFVAHTAHGVPHYAHRRCWKMWVAARVGKAIFCPLDREENVNQFSPIGVAATEIDTKLRLQQRPDGVEFMVRKLITLSRDGTITPRASLEFLEVSRMAAAIESDFDKNNNTDDSTRRFKDEEARHKKNLARAFMNMQKYANMTIVLRSRLAEAGARVRVCEHVSAFLNH